MSCWDFDLIASVVRTCVVEDKYAVRFCRPKSAPKDPILFFLVAAVIISDSIQVSLVLAKGHPVQLPSVIVHRFFSIIQVDALVRGWSEILVENV